MPDDHAGALTPSEPGQVPALRVDRAHAVCLRDEAALGMKEGLGRATREGLRIAREARPGDVFEIVAPEHLAAGLKDGTLRMATPGSGDASVLIKNANDGRHFAGRADLIQAKPTPLDVLGPAAWQALALATQQHYLAEISAKLEGIQASVDEVLARMDDELIAALKDISASAAQARSAIDRDGTLGERRLADLRADAKEARRLWFETAETAGRHIDDYKAGKSRAERVEQSLAMLMHAARVLVQCSDTIVTAGYSTAKELDEVLSEERDRVYPAVPQLLALCERAAGISDEWQLKHERYEELRPKNKAARTLRVPVVRINQDEQATSFTLRRRPKQQPLTDEALDRVRALVGAGPDDASQPLVVEIAEDGSVLVGPSTASLSAGS